MVVFLRETAFGRVVVQAAELLRAVDSDGEDSDSDGVRFLLILSLFYACFTTDLRLIWAYFMQQEGEGESPHASSVEPS